jgi:arylsulfatase A-like enzyme
MNFARIVVIVVVSFCGLARAQGPQPTAPARRPNIIFILADDLGWSDLACQGSKYYESPNIDRLATEGMRFTDGYSCGPNCQPSRAALMSGQYEPRTGIYTVGNIDRFAWETRPLRPVDNVQELPLEKVIIAQVLKDAGYATAMFGKWHLGDNGPHHPSKRGFDDAIVSAGKHFDFDTTPAVVYPKGQYLADFLTDHAVDFIKKHKDEPFFLYLPHYGVHSPYQAKPELIEKFKKKDPVGGHKDATYAAMIYSVDESVGRIVKTLDELKLAENTLVIFSSDNGGVGGYARAGVPTGRDVTDNAPLRGGKGMLYEGGVRVPFIFRWKGKIAPGTTSHQPIIGVDMYPTLLELTSASKRPNYPLDGESVMPVLLSDGSAKLSRDTLYWHFPGYLGAGEGWRTTPAGAIRVGDMKLIEFFEDRHVELYNLKDDLSQQHDLAIAQPDVAKSMHDRLVKWREQTGAKMPTANDPKTVGAKKKRRNKGGNDDA